MAHFIRAFVNSRNKLGAAPPSNYFIIQMISAQMSTEVEMLCSEIRSDSKKVESSIDSMAATHPSEQTIHIDDVFSEDEDERMQSMMFPEELSRFLRNRIRMLKAENGQLKRNLEECHDELMEKRSQQKLSYRNSKDHSVLLEPGRATDVAASKIAELSRRLREMYAELEGTKTKHKNADAKVVMLTAELHKLQKQHSEQPLEPLPVDEDQVKVLTEKLQSSNAKMRDFRNQNLQLRQELKVAQRALSNEIGENVTIQSLVAQGSNFRGRAQQIIHLQQKVTELTEKLQGHSSVSEESTRSKHLLAIEKEKRAIQERTTLELKESQVQLDDTKRKLDAQRARTKILESEAGDMKSKMSVLLEKSEHDNQLVAALTSQLRMAEESSKDRKALLNAEIERNTEQCRRLEKTLTAERESNSRHKADLAEKDKMLECLQLQLERIDVPKMETSRATTPRTDMGSGDTKLALQAAEAERMRLLELIAVFHKRLDEQQMLADDAQDKWRKERYKAACLETKVSRLEMERKSLVKVGCYRAKPSDTLKAQLLSVEERQRLELLEEENTLLKFRLETMRKEKAEDMMKYTALLQQPLGTHGRRTESLPSVSSSSEGKSTTSKKRR